MVDLKTTKYKIGIDEVGRGPLAGPVAVCAFLIKDENFLELAISRTYGKNDKEGKKLSKLKDSKKLSKKQREEWYEYLKVAKAEGLCDFAVSFVSPENIDKFGIAKCIQKALNQSLEKIATLASFQILLDGGLHAPAEYVNQETFIKGDEIHPVISLASIVAKVSRDNVMTKYASDYPEYGFDQHSGYGTRAHYEAIKKHGQTPIHRKSFIH